MQSNKDSHHLQVSWPILIDRDMSDFNILLCLRNSFCPQLFLVLTGQWAYVHAWFRRRIDEALRFRIVHGSSEAQNCRQWGGTGSGDPSTPIVSDFEHLYCVREHRIIAVLKTGGQGRGVQVVSIKLVCNIVSGKHGTRLDSDWEYFLFVPSDWKEDEPKLKNWINRLKIEGYWRGFGNRAKRTLAVVCQALKEPQDWSPTCLQYMPWFHCRYSSSISGVYPSI